MARINRVIELLEQGQPVYYTGAGELTYENGRARAGTWADFLMVDFEHHAFDIAGGGQEQAALGRRLTRRQMPV